MSVWPPMTNFKRTVRADSAVSARSPLPPPIKALAHCLSVCYFSKIKQTFLSTLYWLLSGEQPDLTFGNTCTFWISLMSRMDGCLPSVSAPPLGGLGADPWELSVPGAWLDSISQSRPSHDDRLTLLIPYRQVPSRDLGKTLSPLLQHLLTPRVKEPLAVSKRRQRPKFIVMIRASIITYN